MKKFIGLFIFSIIICSFSCSSEENTQIEDQQTSIKEDTSSYANREDIFTCQNFTVGIGWPLTLETVVHYCCVGSSLCLPSVAQQGCLCGFVSDTKYEKILEINAANRAPYSIHVSTLIPNENPKTITITYSGSFFVGDKEYKIYPKSYNADKNGYIVLELIEI